jgi:hypothetical protein
MVKKKTSSAAFVFDELGRWRWLRVPGSFPLLLLFFPLFFSSSGVVWAVCHQGGSERDGKGWGSARGGALYSVLAHGKADGAMAIGRHGGSRCYLGWC